MADQHLGRVVDVDHVNRAAYDKAHQLIARGVWTVDAERGTITNQQGPFTGLDSWGYIQIKVWDRGYHGYVKGHRVIWEYVHGPIMDDALEINHLNGIKWDNRLANLELVTPSENVKHAHRTGLHSLKGSRNNNAKLTEQTVREIKAALVLGETGRSIARRYGLTPTHVSSIKRGRRWSHVTLDL